MSLPRSPAASLPESVASKGGAKDKSIPALRPRACDQPGPVVGRKILVDQVENAFAIRVVMAGKVRQKFAG